MGLLEKLNSRRSIRRLQRTRIQDVLELKSLTTHTRSGSTLLNGLDLKIAEGETIVIAAGSTKMQRSLISVLGGLETPYVGTIKLDGSAIYQRSALNAKVKLALTDDKLFSLNSQTSLTETARLWIFQNPTFALNDAEASRFVKSVAAKGRSVGTIIFSNDLRVARHADRVLVLSAGRLRRSTGTEPLWKKDFARHSVDNGQLTPTDVTKGAAFGRITLTKCIGDSTDIATWVGWHSDRIEPVRVKFASTDTGVSKLSREHKLQSGIKSVHVPATIDRVLADHNARTVVEYIGKETAATVADSKEFEMLDVLLLCRDISEALQQIHQADYFNVDLSPANTYRRNKIWLVGDLDSVMEVTSDQDLAKDVASLATLLSLALGKALSNQRSPIVTRKFSKLLSSMRRENPLMRPTAQEINRLCQSLISELIREYRYPAKRSKINYWQS